MMGVGHMVEFNGWEKLEPPIGKGGQSTVYKARCPQRVEQRSKILSSLQAFSDAAKQQSYAEAIYSFSRPDLPGEIGALKIFSFRETSGPPVERLKREIEILKEGRPNLPRLLDSNTDQLWMITEYFRDGTLADCPGKFKGKPLEALVAFRDLVKTVAALHNDGVVHRDIKLENIFVADDATLVLGDFGLVYLRLVQVQRNNAVHPMNERISDDTVRISYLAFHTRCKRSSNPSVL
jgi:serine/threonine protein kinase